MYFEAIDCTVEEAERNAKENYERMCEFDKELAQLWKRRNKYDDTDSQFQEIIEGIDEEIYITESIANKYDTWYDYWSMQAIWAKKRLEKQKKEAEFGYNKANEWHYVKDGDLPKENIYLVIRLNDENTCYKCCTGFWEKEERCFHTLFCDKVDTKDIIAWKEIVLPELPKESER